MPNVNTAILVQGSHQDTDGYFNIYDPVTQGLSPTSTNLIWPGIPDNQNQNQNQDKRKRKNSKSENGQNGQNGNNQNTILIDPR